MKKNQRIIFASLCAVLLAAFFLFAATFYKTRLRILNPTSPAPLTSTQALNLKEVLDRTYPERTQIINPSPFIIKDDELSISAKSAILIDALTGSILYEKNADEIIPPASMTKLVEMYVVLDKVNKGLFSLDDEVPLPRECWAKNMPKDASLMFLNQGQHVTLNELLLGLAIASGNDASVAIARYTAKDMDDFVFEMNSLVKKLGLKKTHFVESSGYSEKNLTTAREFAAFSKAYVQTFPFTIEDYHSQKVLRYPLEKNLPDFQKDQKDSQAIVQYNTNKLLGKLEGCDGLKTGFIYESGYNLALTAKRGTMRLISVTMGGAGKGSTEGNFYRVQDGTALMEYGFSSFYDYTEQRNFSYTVALAGSTLNEVNLIPAQSLNFTLPKSAQSDLQINVDIPRVIYGTVRAGDCYGKIEYISQNKTVATVDLVSDRTSLEAGFAKRIFDAIVVRSIRAQN